MIHKPSRKHYKTQRTYVDGLAQQIQMDLVDMSKFSYKNKGNRWILTVIEVLSPYAFAVPVWRKNTENMTKAVEKVLAQFKERFGSAIRRRKIILQRRSKDAREVKIPRFRCTGTSSVILFY
jgi:hypothetical protein